MRGDENSLEPLDGSSAPGVIDWMAELGLVDVNEPNRHRVVTDYREQGMLPQETEDGLVDLGYLPRKQD